MLTIELEKNEVLQKTHFRDARNLYEYLHEYFLSEKLGKIENEESSGPMTYKESLVFLDSL